MKKCIDFLSHGVSCFGVCLLEKLGIWENLKTGFDFYLFKKNTSNNSLVTAIRAAFISLERDKIIRKDKMVYFLTKFGLALDKQIGLILMFFDGYRFLAANQEKVVMGKEKFPQKFIDGEAIAYASIKFSEHTSEPILLREIAKLKAKMICDLGCGSGSNLIKICQKLQLQGIGIDVNDAALNLGNSLLKDNSLITLIKDDISGLNNTYPEVDILLLDFVLHDFVPQKKCIQTLNSLLKNFPNMKYFFITDIVSPSDRFPFSLPGFDYSHGLLGIQTRTYEENKLLFEQSNYSIYKEIPIKTLPNTFLWILKPV